MTSKKPLSTLLPACLCLVAGAARADLSPYSVGAIETVTHESNVYHGPTPVGDWLSTTELNAALDQALGRDRLTANGAFDLNRYKSLGGLDSNAYRAAAAFDWSTIGDISGSLGADSSRKQYLYGLTGEAPSSTARNLETDNHAFAHAQVGGPGDWTIYGGFDANSRSYTDSAFAPYEERQWSGDGGTRYQTSPDLSFGLDARYTRGRYPHFSTSGPDDFSLRSLDLTSTWHASGNSVIDVRAGYSSEHDQAQPTSNYFNGALNWNWTPPSHLKFTFGLERDSDADATAGSGVGSVNLTGRSLNSTAHFSASYEVSPKTSFSTGLQYTKRQYTDAILPIVNETDTTAVANGSNRTTQFNIGVHYEPTRISDLSCSFEHELRKSDAQLESLAPGYTANNFMCAAQVKFD